MSRVRVLAAVALAIALVILMVSVVSSPLPERSTDEWIGVGVVIVITLLSAFVGFWLRRGRTSTTGVPAWGSSPAAFETRADRPLQTVVVMDLVEKTSAWAQLKGVPPCKRIGIGDIFPVEESRWDSFLRSNPRTLAFLRGGPDTWCEVWLVDWCGQMIPCAVAFSHDPNGNTKFEVADLN